MVFEEWSEAVNSDLCRWALGRALSNLLAHTTGGFERWTLKLTQVFENNIASIGFAWSACSGSFNEEVFILSCLGLIGFFEFTVPCVGESYV